MSDLSLYLSPVAAYSLTENSLGQQVHIHNDKGFPDLDKPGVALVYVPEYRRSLLNFNAKNNETFRQQFYSMYSGDAWSEFKLYDLGTINPGERIEDTYFAVARVIEECAKKNIIVALVGGSQDLTLACYQGYEKLEQMINICSIDAKLDVGSPEEEIDASKFVSQLLLQRPCYLFNYAVVGVQRPLVPRKEVDLFGNLYFDICRLGAFNDDFKRAEPHLRNSDLIVVDFDSIKSGDTDSNVYKQPNGFRADQICKIMHYSGLSDKLSSIAITNLNPDQNENASMLCAQMLWYFIDGYAQRVGDFPVGSKSNYKKFYVSIDDLGDELVFYKSNKSNRWWLEVQYPSGKENLYMRHQLVPCNADDYEQALQNAIPDLWWQTLQKLTT